MFTDNRLALLSERYEQIKFAYKQMIDEKRAASSQTVISKRKRYNVLPYEAERNGDKLNGKAIPEPIIHNDCYIYRINAQGQVLLSERMSESLKIPTYFTLYTYEETLIERIYGDNHRVYRVEWAYLEDGIVKEVLCCAKESNSIEVYQYDGAALAFIHHFQKSNKNGAESRFDLAFHYNKKGVLACIIRVWPSGRTETIFSTAKLNFKVLGGRLYSEIAQEVSIFLSAHKGERLTRFALDCYSGHGYVSLCMDTSLDEEFRDSPADWTYCDFASLPLVEFPLDDSQSEKLGKTILQVAAELRKAECFDLLAVDTAFEILVFDHNVRISK
ncbi:hypothetical protein LJC63_12895 [Ruminococcaceae bacterium OttesenSCG-928-L11]|nr:hypothetical protein [Ruminococcaceae bacterium OttesenSCG-928-L11]